LEDQTEVQEWFKLFFDPAEYERARQLPFAFDYLPPSHGDVIRWYRDFLNGLYRHLEQVILSFFGPWAETDVTFLFSVPTTWTKLRLTQGLVLLAREAGFGSAGPRHSVEVSLTEAEAAAVFTFKSQHQEYSVRLSVHQPCTKLIRSLIRRAM
jgi:hypothetical protein